MTPDDLEKEQVALVAELESGRPLTPELRGRIDALAAAIREATPLTPVEEALAEVLQETVALSDRKLPPGLDVRVHDDVLEVLSRGDVVGTVSRTGLLERADEIEAERAKQARHH